MLPKLMRGALALAALVAAGWAISWSSDARQCKQARADVLLAVLTEDERTEGVDRVLAHCRDPEAIAQFVPSLADYDPDQAMRLAAHAAAEAPDTFSTWAALVLVETDRDRAHHAWLRARQLNPRWSAPDPAAAN